MTEKQENPKHTVSKLGLTAEGAAGASVAQSVSLAAQSEVDAVRNQNTVNMVATGMAYAKWLQNPLMGEPFRDLVKTANTKTGADKYVQTETSGRKGESPAGAFVAAGANLLSDEVFSYFLSSRHPSE